MVFQVLLHNCLYVGKDHDLDTVDSGLASKNGKNSGVGQGNQICVYSTYGGEKDLGQSIPEQNLESNEKDLGDWQEFLI